MTDAEEVVEVPGETEEIIPEPEAPEIPEEVEPETPEEPEHEIVPGDRVRLTGSDWANGSNVKFQFTEQLIVGVYDTGFDLGENPYFLDGPRKVFIYKSEEWGDYSAEFIEHVGVGADDLPKDVTITVPAAVIQSAIERYKVAYEVISFSIADPNKFLVTVVGIDQKLNVAEIDPTGLILWETTSTEPVNLNLNTSVEIWDEVEVHGLQVNKP